MNMKKHSYFCLTSEFALAIMNAKLKFYSHFKNKLSHSLAAGDCGLMQSPEDASPSTATFRRKFSSRKICNQSVLIKEI